MPMFFGQTGASTGSYQLPFLGLFDADFDGDIKGEHDAYDIYVNEEFVGKKLLLTESENVVDVVSFLKQQGVQQVSAQLDGDHYIIRSEESERIKQILDAYLQNR
ncbi:hypothetical protein [Halalkalibacter alkaliphilus]|uniref:Uncharacterized protein n=1 Tax=Halalkalibacter alkaliphilus TaxID=2917993 RepID=A0A9X2CW53_9BACI|nr:hypothetical protein [Halalkalibacter alkaliphilus]MCL7749415.1 hypothetical protein [Halalkalibacter alkaliphilus]